jgi:S1-C subfamily serine protease
VDVLDHHMPSLVNVRRMRMSRLFGGALLAASVGTAAVLLMLGRVGPSTSVGQGPPFTVPALFGGTVADPSTTSTTEAPPVATEGTVVAQPPAAVITSRAAATPTTDAPAQNLSAAVAALWRTQSSSSVAMRVGGQLVTIVTSRSRSVSKGTGMVLTPDGLVLTNAHVVEDPRTIVATAGGTGPRYSARVMAKDPVHDIAVVQLIGAAGLPTVTTGSAGSLSVGSSVMAVGNAASGATSLTGITGIVLELKHDLLATDPGHPDEVLNSLIAFMAPVEAGQSGGPLVDGSGDVVGMVTAGGPNAAGVMIGFAIPIDTALTIANHLLGR